MYVARFTETPNEDIERGWSGYFAPFEQDLRSALEFIGVDTDDYEDDELEDIADEYKMMQDPHTKAWRPFHHYGLSCWALSATTEEEAIEEAKNAKISWGGFGQRTMGNVELVATISDTGDIEKDGVLRVFKCEDAQNEG